MNIKYQQQSAEQRDAFSSSSAEKIHLLTVELEQTAEQLKNTERQLSAAKLLVRQSKKDNKQLEERLARAQQQETRPASQPNS